MTTPTPDRTPTADLRERLAEALTREHYRRARERIEASPEEHCAAFADAVLSVVEAETAALRQRAEEAERQRDAALAAAQRVRELHQPTQGLGYDCDEDDTPGSYGDIAEVCTSCGTADEYGVRWPCPTIAALDQPKETP